MRFINYTLLEINLHNLFVQWMVCVVFFFFLPSVTRSFFWLYKKNSVIFISWYFHVNQPIHWALNPAWFLYRKFNPVEFSNVSDNNKKVQLKNWLQYENIYIKKKLFKIDRRIYIHVVFDIQNVMPNIHIQKFHSHTTRIHHEVDYVYFLFQLTTLCYF